MKWAASMKESGGEAVAEFLAPWDALGSGQPLVDQIEGGEEEQRLVRSLVWLPFLHRRGADAES
jgi:hypothetical protein